VRVRLRLRLINNRDDGDCGGGGGSGGGKINSDTTHRHCCQLLFFIVTGRAAHGRIGRLFQNLISEEEVVAEAEAVDVAAPDICRRSYWMDTRYTSPYAAPTKNANANDE